MTRGREDEREFLKKKREDQVRYICIQPAHSGVNFQNRVGLS